MKTFPLESNPLKQDCYHEIKKLSIAVLIIVCFINVIFGGSVHAQCAAITVSGYGWSSTDQNAANTEALTNANTRADQTICEFGCVKTNCTPATITSSHVVHGTYYLIQAQSTCTCIPTACAGRTASGTGWGHDEATASANAVTDATTRANAMPCEIGCVKGICGPPSVTTSQLDDDHWSASATITCQCNPQVRSGESNDHPLNSNAIYPNPSNGNTHIQYIGSSNGMITLTIYDQLGNQLLAENFNSIEGMNTFSLYASSLNSGIYMLVIYEGNKATSMKMLVNK